jgi:hypothetical protein
MDFGKSMSLRNQRNQIVVIFIFIKDFKLLHRENYFLLFCFRVFNFLPWRR